MTSEMLNIAFIFLFNNIAVQAFSVFKYDGSLSPSETPSFASLVSNVQLLETFIVCSSSKEETFNKVGFFTIFGDDGSEWLTVGIRPFWPVVVLIVYWDGGFYLAGEIENPKLDYWYHICLKVDLLKDEIKFAINGELLGKVVGVNITNTPSKLNISIGVGQDNKQFHGSVANIQVYREVSITKMSASPCKVRQESLLAWNSQDWKIVGSHWLLTTENQEMICFPYELYNLAVPSKITLMESMDICKEKLNNGVIPHPENQSAFQNYVTWHRKTTGDSCPTVWTPLSDQNSEGVFLNMNNNSEEPFQKWGKAEPNGGKSENNVKINLKTAAMYDVDEKSFACSTCSLSTSLLLQLDGVCEDSFIGNIVLKKQMLSVSQS